MDGILELTRSHVKLRIGDRTVTIEGEAYMPGYGSPDFVVYMNTLQRWDPPDGESIREDERTRILEVMRRGFAERNLSYEVE